MTEEHTEQPTCAGCSNLLAVRYGRKNLFFCQRGGGGDYGLRTTKGTPACPDYLASAKKTVPRIDRRGGDSLKGLRK